MNQVSPLQSDHLRVKRAFVPFLARMGAKALPQAGRLGSFIGSKSLAGMSRLKGSAGSNLSAGRQGLGFAARNPVQASKNVGNAFLKGVDPVKHPNLAGLGFSPYRGRKAVLGLGGGLGVLQTEDPINNPLSALGNAGLGALTFGIGGALKAPWARQGVLGYGVGNAADNVLTAQGYDNPHLAEIMGLGGLGLGKFAPKLLGSVLPAAGTSAAAIPQALAFDAVPGLGNNSVENIGRNVVNEQVDRAQETIMDRAAGFANEVMDQNPQIENNIQSLVTKGQDPAQMPMSSLFESLDQVGQSIGLDTGSMTPMQKLLIAFGVPVGALGLVTGSPLLAAGGLAATAGGAYPLLGSKINPSASAPPRA